MRSAIVLLAIVGILVAASASEPLPSEVPDWYKEWTSAYRQSWQDFWRLADEQMLTGVLDRRLSDSEKIAVGSADSLRGILAVRPQVIFCDPPEGPLDPRCLGEFQIAVESYLTRSAVPVSSNSQFPRLWIGVGICDIDPGTYLIGVFMELQEAAIMPRSPHPRQLTVTSWSMSNRETLAKRKPTKADVLSEVNKSLDEFVRYYLIGNGRPSAEK